MKYLKKLAGEHCYLSPIDIAATEIMAKWNNDMDVAINTGNASVMITFDEQEGFLNNFNNIGHAFLIIDNKADEPIGFCRLKNIDWVNRRAELGIFIGEKDYWSLGIGTEAVKLILDYGFNILNLRNVMLGVYSFNERAIKSYIKCGFKEIGRRRSSIICGGMEYDEVFMDILSDELNESKYNQF